MGWLIYLILYVPLWLVCVWVRHFYVAAVCLCNWFLHLRVRIFVWFIFAPVGSNFCVIDFCTCGVKFDVIDFCTCGGQIWCNCFGYVWLFVWYCSVVLILHSWVLTFYLVSWVWDWCRCVNVFCLCEILHLWGRIWCNWFFAAVGVNFCVIVLGMFDFLFGIALLC